MKPARPLSVLLATIAITPALIFSAAPFAQTPPVPTTLNVEVKGALGASGKVMLALYKSDDKWMGKAFMVGAAEVKQDGVKVAFAGLAEGEYAISLFVDSNNNGRLDTNPIGIPIEPYAFSNDAMGSFGPPTFAQAKFVVEASKTITINVK